MSKKKKISLVLVGIILLPILWWLIFGAGVPVIKNLLGIDRKEDVIIRNTSNLNVGGGYNIR